MLVPADHAAVAAGRGVGPAAGDQIGAERRVEPKLVGILVHLDPAQIAGQARELAAVVGDLHPVPGAEAQDRIAADAAHLQPVAAGGNRLDRGADRGVVPRPLEPGVAKVAADVQLDPVELVLQAADSRRRAAEGRARRGPRTRSWRWSGGRPTGRRGCPRRRVSEPQVASAPTSASTRTCQTVCRRVAVSMPFSAGSSRPRVLERRHLALPDVEIDEVRAGGGRQRAGHRADRAGPCSRRNRRPRARSSRPARPRATPPGRGGCGRRPAALAGADPRRGSRRGDRRRTSGRGRWSSCGPAAGDDLEAGRVSRGTTARPMMSTVSARSRRSTMATNSFQSASRVGWPCCMRTPAKSRRASKLLRL